MTYVVIAIIFFLALAITLRGGLAMGFIWVYIPVQLLLPAVPPIPLPGWPDVGSPAAAMYGIILGAVLAGRKLPAIRWNFLDTLVLAVAGAIMFSAGLTEHAYTAISMFGDRAIEWILPYFLARIAFHSESARAKGLRGIAICLGIMACFGVIETRLWPYYLSRQLQTLNLFDGVNTMVYLRFGFFRAQLSFQHPIDLGNVALLLLGIIPLLALTTEIGMKKLYVRLAWAAALFLLVISISFTAYFGLAMMVAVFLVLRYCRWIRPYLVAMVVLGIGAAVAYTGYVVAQKLPPRPPANDIFACSLWIRKEIVHRAWNMGQHAGLFGYGRMINTNELGLSSVDNAYLLMLLERGWVTLALFLMIPIVVAAQTSRALRRAADESQALPLIIAMATIGGIMTAMYTAWFGDVYSNFFVVMLGFTATLVEFFNRQPAVSNDYIPESIGIGDEILSEEMFGPSLSPPV